MPGAGERIWWTQTPDRVQTELRKHADDTLVVWSGGEAAVSVSLHDRRVGAPSQPEARTLRAVAGMAIPLLAQSQGGLVLHAAAAGTTEGATLICGLSRSGKSTLHTGLLGRGWEAISDDVCVIDVGAGAAQVWPGPSWARLSRSAAKPDGDWRPRYEDEIKDAWDLDPFMRREAATVSRIVFLERKDAAALGWRSIAGEEAIGRLAPLAPWLLEPVAAREHVFPLVVSLASAAPSFLLEVPDGPGWPERAIHQLCEG